MDIFVLVSLLMRRSDRKNSLPYFYVQPHSIYSLEVLRWQPRCDIQTRSRPESFKEKTFNRTCSPGPTIKRVHYDENGT